MTDFPGQSGGACAGFPRTAYSTASFQCPAGQLLHAINTAWSAGAVWPTANLAMYVSMPIQEPITVTQMAVQVAVTGGNVDVAIYDEGLNKVTPAASTGTGAAGIQVFNITDTPLRPGHYYFGMSCTSGVASFFRGAPVIQAARVCGCAQQATAAPLPSTATFATYAQTYVPLIIAAGYTPAM